MSTLDTYLREQHRDDTSFRKRLLKTIDEVIPIFYLRKREISTAPKGLTWSTWPYSAKATDSPPSGAASDFSASTHGMILFTLDSFMPRQPEHHPILLGPEFRPCKLIGPSTNSKELAAVVESATEYLITEVGKWNDKNPEAISGTYGKNDPFTLTWLVELAFGLLGPAAPRDVLERILKAAIASLTRETILETPSGGNRFKEVTGSFLKVRRLHLILATRRLANARSITPDEKDWPPRDRLWKEFDSTLHRQLSYYAMGDQKFDPAELAFAFEGSLLLEPNWVPRGIVDKVFEALSLKPAGQPFWRPVTPFLANERGQALFLVSVEVANSILRSCALLDKGKLQPEAFARIESHLRTYANWVLGEAERGEDATTKKELVGWRSEYGEERGLIHLWHTSHVLVFLAHYEYFLKRKIAADGLEAAGLSVGYPEKEKIADFWVTDEPLIGLSAPEGRYAVHNRVLQHYIQPRIKGEVPEFHSVLLYGPPGTGKTTIAEQMAIFLKQRLVTVTVSDFLAAGDAELENRAKGVFKVLRSLENVVILFDEIDQFLLDRNSRFYDAQSDVFKFMTPGMLNKLQDLRDDGDSIFILATNYFERIDSAIKRRGRVDNHLLLSIPNMARRKALLIQFIAKYFSSPTLPADVTSLPGFAQLIPDTVFFGWGDLKYLVKSTAAAKVVPPPANLCPTLSAKAKDTQLAVNLPAYSSRFDPPGPYPTEEFFLLAYLMVESGKVFSDSDIEVIKKAVQALKLTAKNYGKHMSGYIKEDTVVNALKSKLSRYLLK